MGVNDISEQNLPIVYRQPVNCITHPGIMALVTPLQRYIAEEIPDLLLEESLPFLLEPQ